MSKAMDEETSWCDYCGTGYARVTWIPANGSKAKALCRQCHATQQIVLDCLKDYNVKQGKKLIRAPLPD
jgi:hypothetical protein